ncbi:hypothetical protein EZS27_039167, partial [termite gut metagenome]
MDANLTGHLLSEIEGNIDINNISFTSPKSALFIKNINLSTTTFGKTKELIINSDFLKGKIEGEYSYQTIPATLFYSKIFTNQFLQTKFIYPFIDHVISEQLYISFIVIVHVEITYPFSTNKIAGNRIHDNFYRR